jgi:AMP deaminase
MAADNQYDDQASFDDHDFVPHFQRVSISGEEISGVPLEDLERASELIVRALELRERYMSMSIQSFPQTTGRFVRVGRGHDDVTWSHGERKTIAGN